MGVVLGALGHGGTISRADYGFFSININAIFNPKSCGGYTWSNLLPIQPQIPGNYDGFNYLGLGILLLLLSVGSVNVYIYVIKRRKLSQQNFYYLLAMLFLLCFAITNVITFQDKILLTIPIPERVVKLCGIFRASSRMFYPIFYTIYIYLLYKVCDLEKTINKYLPIVIISLTVFIQIFDLSSVIKEKHIEMGAKNGTQSILDDDVLNHNLENIKYIVRAFDYQGDDRSVAVWTGKIVYRRFFR